jgi:UDP-4-amino-4,6-dideoxy-N-acetyl-beta-L-altrosamine transaminase
VSAPGKGRRVPYARQSINREDIDAVIETLESDWLTQGPAIERFEKKVADYCGAKYAVAVANGTAALHIATLAAGVAPGDEVWTSPNTFVASANAALYCGAKPDFVDIDARTYNLCAGKLEEKLKSRRPPKVLIPVHFSGQPCDMEALSKLARERGITIIEDAAHALGASRKGEKVGSGRFADMTTLSFHPVKIITTGEGGMVLTNRPDLYEKLILLRSHGITRDSREMANESEGAWYYEQIGLGFNYRITDIQAALGISQMDRCDEFIARRRVLAGRYDQLLAPLPLILPFQAHGSFSAWHLYVVQIDSTRTSKTRREVFDHLRAAGIGVNVHYIPVHRQPFYRRLGFKAGDFPEAERYYQNALSIPMFPAMSDEDQDYVVEKLAEAFERS